ncbi:hypothetical protein THICB2_280060 [Thiomonas sp. CB2]|nr:hypothetical protein THICB2_280060 [Thiomonas sp. CB2]VDY05436.1 protein of unknown function [Thiomonas sp. Bio17B3]VDY13686.1 conserved protein of unknown function [Thiomonas sp. OC7]
MSNNIGFPIYPMIYIKLYVGIIRANSYS